jgi:hypothetical protein
VEFEITPQPSPEEREALLIALEQALAERGNGSGAWWNAGARENVEDDEASKV